MQQDIQYRGLWWRVTNRHNGYLTIERSGRSMTISGKLVTGTRARRPDPAPCRRCHHRHRSYEWCRSN